MTLECDVEEGIYFGMPEDVYHAAQALSCSGMKKLAVSPLHYWHECINPERIRPEESAFQRYGKAMHCRLLEPERFLETYRRKPSPPEDALVTMDDLKAFCVTHSLSASAKRKQDLIDRILSSGIPAVIWDIEMERLASDHDGKTVLSADEFDLVEYAASTICRIPVASSAFSGGMAEVSFFVKEPETGVMLKARMDYVKPTATIDLKTFSNSRGKPTEKAVFDSIYYEGYYLQCTVYHTIREIARQKLIAGELQTHGMVSEEWLKGFSENDRHGFGFVFIESEAPFDLRLMQMRRSEAKGADCNVYWSTAEMRMAEMIRLYAEQIDRYGEDEWRDPVGWRIVSDMDLPQLMFAA